MEKEDSKRDLGEVDDTGLKLHSIDTLAQLRWILALDISPSSKT